MKRRLLALILAMAMILVAAGCGTSPSSSAPDASGSTADNSDTSNSDAPAEGGKFKIGIMTTTVSQSEESYRNAEAIQKMYPDIVVLVTFPERFTTEQETTISTALSLAADPDIKAILFCQAAQGTAAAMEKIKEVRPDILLLAGGVQDDLNVISSVADIAFHMNIPAAGTQLVEEMHKKGVETFVHYSFPRHLAFQPTAERRDNIKAACEQYGMTFVEETTPDPTSDAGVSGTQQFILEDVPRKVAEYGPKTAFMGTNTAQQEPMIKAIIQEKAYYTMPADPSPFQSYPGALSIEVPEDKMADAQFMMDQISAKLAEVEMTDHMGTWACPLFTLFMRGGFEYAMAYCNGETDGKYDRAMFEECMTRAAGCEVEYESYVDSATGETHENMIYLLAEYQSL